MVRQSMALIQQIPNDQERSYVAAIFVELGIRWLDDASKQQIRKWVERVDLVKEIVDDAVEKARNGGEHKKAVQMAEKMFRKGSTISDVVDITGLSEPEAEEIQRNL